MTEPEYRQDDTTDGYCPTCGQPLTAMTTGGARGYCETHGWQFANWTPYGTGPHWSANTADRGCPLCGSATYYTIAGVVRRSDSYPDVCREPLCPIAVAANLIPGVMTGEEAQP